MGDAPNITTEILIQIRDEMRGMRGSIDSLRTEMKQEMGELRNVVTQHGRIVDHALHVSLEDSGRLEAVEGSVRTLEAEVRELKER